MCDLINICKPIAVNQPLATKVRKAREIDSPTCSFLETRHFPQNQRVKQRTTNWFILRREKERPIIAVQAELDTIHKNELSNPWRAL